MRILLSTLNSKYIHSNLALKYLYAATSESENTIDVKEFTINNDNDSIYVEVVKGEYDLICFSCYIWNIERILYLSELIKSAKPNTLILLGGPEISYRAEYLLRRHKYVDMILGGEAEVSFPKLIAILDGTDKQSGLESIRGLYFRNEGRIHINPPALPVQPESIPFPYKCFVGEPDKILYYESSRGCPYSCSFCLSSIEKGVRSLPLDRVMLDLSYFIYKKVKQVKFIDRTFNYDSRRCREILGYLNDNDNGITNFHFEICAELLDEKTIDLLSNVRKGLFQFEIGVQSTNPETLRAIQRKTDLNKLSENIRSLIAIGNIHLHLDLIAGLPFEDYNSFMRSFNQIYKLQPDYLQLGFLKLLPGTLIRREAEVFAYVFQSKPPYEVISNNYMSPDDLIKLKMIERVFDLYYNRGGFKSTLEYACEELYGNPFSFYEELSKFFYHKGYQNKSHKKEDLYRILRLFAMEKDHLFPGAGERLQTLLLNDMQNNLNPEVVKRFMNKGWELEDEADR